MDLNRHCTMMNSYAMMLLIESIQIPRPWPSSPSPPQEAANEQLAEGLPTCKLSRPSGACISYPLIMASSLTEPDLKISSSIMSIESHVIR